MLLRLRRGGSKADRGTPLSMHHSICNYSTGLTSAWGSLIILAAAAKAIGSAALMAHRRHELRCETCLLWPLLAVASISARLTFAGHGRGRTVLRAPAVLQMMHEQPVIAFRFSMGWTGALTTVHLIWHQSSGPPLFSVLRAHKLCFGNLVNPEMISDQNCVAVTSS